MNHETTVSLDDPDFQRFAQRRQQQDIVRMALEAGLDPHDMSSDFTCNLQDLERFAEIVCKDYSTTHANLWLDRIHKFVLEEREQCAQVADRMTQHTYLGSVGKAIRAKGQA